MNDLDLHFGGINTRILQARNLRRMSMAEFEERVGEENNDNSYRYWHAAAGVLDVSSSWIIHGRITTEEDAQASRTRARF